MDRVVSGLVSVLTAVVLVGALAVIFAPRATTPQVVRETFRGLGGALESAARPVSGGSSVGLGLS